MEENKADKGITLKFWGVRGSTPCANATNMKFGGNTTCLQVEIPGTDEVLIMDSGTGIRNLGNMLVERKKTIQGRIFITHPHWDHIQGFPFFKPIYDSENHFCIHMPPQTSGGCKEILSGHLNKTFFPVSLEMIDANLEYVTQKKERQEYGRYDVEYMLSNHPLNTAAYKIHLDGKIIVFCPDNELSPGSDHYIRFKKFVRGADLLIHDAQYDRKSIRERRGWGHSAWEDVVDFAAECGLEKVMLTHHNPDSDDAYLSKWNEKLQAENASRFELIRLAREGSEIIL